MLREGRLPLLAAEHDAVDTLIAKNPGASVSLTRRDPGETGPLLVHVGDIEYQVDEHGQVSRNRKRKAS